MRWLVTAATAIVVLVPLALVLGRGSPARTVASAAEPGAAAADATRSPWYGMQLLLDRVELTAAAGQAAKPPPIDAAAGILVDADTGAILWQSNAHAQLPPASTIKLLTAMVVLENLGPSRTITVTPNALFTSGDESKMYLGAGQRVSVADLLTGLLTVSANDAADTLAVDTVGMERFVGAMNAQATAIGLKDTHATTPVGLDDPAMYSSAYDLAVLAMLDYRHWPLFREIVATKYTVIQATAYHPTYYLNNLNLLLSMYPAAVGIKTGYTGNAGNCLVGMAVRGSHRLVSVLLNAPYVYGQSRKLLDWGFVVEGLPTQLPTPSPSPAASLKPSPAPHH